MATVLDRFRLTGTADGTPPGPDASWLPAVVPGGVHESLLAAGLIGHPYRGENESGLRWVEERTWWYRGEFASGPAPAAAGERLLLHFDALDGVAKIWLNGAELGSHANQHRPARFDITDLVQPRNQLLVRFTPPLAGLLEPGEAEAAVSALHQRLVAIHPGVEAPSVESTAIRLARPRRRKATCSWGWDFAPRVPSVGLQGPVHLESRPVVRLAGTHVRTAALDLGSRTATVAVFVEVAGPVPAGARVRALVSEPSGEERAVELPAAARVETSFELSAVEAWWTHDLGGQPLYSLRAELLVDGTATDVVEHRFGIRTVELDRRPDPEGGRLFQLRLNGLPVFARGANWVPASLLVGSVTDETYRGLVGTAVRGNMNMLRVWGGGIYERDVFYDACDERGVLVWQDFMFACDDYPSEDPVLRSEVAAEAEHQVRRLRNHPSLALWAGNNEVQALHGWTTGSLEPGNWGWSFFHELLPAVVARHSPGAVYWPGSPWGEDGTEGVNGVLDGDRHAWEVWHGVDFGAGGQTEYATRGEAVHFHRYAHDLGKFISEFGIHAAPEVGTLQRWTEPGSLALRSAAFDHRNKDNPKDKGFALMERETGLPQTLEEYVAFSMACQAEGLKFGVEHYRRRQPHCSGTLVWQFNDVWPGFSWSVVDHDLVPKAGYYFLQRAFRPVLASFRAGPDGLELWVTNSGGTPAELPLVVEVAPFSGPADVRHELTVRVEPHSSQPVWQGDLPGADRFAWVSSPLGGVEPNRQFFAPLRELPLATGAVSLEAVRTSRTTARVALSATGYCYFTRLLTPRPGVVFDANYLDLRSGERRTISVSGLTPDDDLAALEVQTWPAR